MYQFDQVSIKERLKDRTRTYFGDNNIVFGGTNEHLFENFSEELANAMHYDEQMTLETKWDKARQRSSVMSQVEFYPYTPHRKIGAIGEIVLSASPTFDGGHSENIVFNKFSEITNGDRSVVTTAEGLLRAGESYITLPVVQGVLKIFEKEITAVEYPSGTEYLQVKFENDSLDTNFYEVYVNGIKYTELSNIRLAEDSQGHYYSLRNNRDFSGVTLQFGNNTFGKKLAYGDIVTFKAVETDGAYGNILRLNSLTKIVNPVKDNTGFKVDLFTKNPEEIVGGQGYESLESIKINAPNSFKSGKNAISKADYRTLVLDSNLAQECTIWGVDEINEELGNEAGTFLPTEENMVYIAGYTYDTETHRGTSLTDVQQQAIRDMLVDIKSPTDIVSFADSQFIYVIFHIEAYISDRTVNEDALRSRIDETLIDTYGLKNAHYKKNLYRSNYLSVLDQVEGINHHRTNITFESYHNMHEAYAFNLDLNIEKIKPYSLKISAKIFGEEEWQVIGVDDGVGNITGQLIDPEDEALGYFSFPTAFFNYATGNAGEIIVSRGFDQPYENYELKLEFELDDSTSGDLELTRRMQIIGYIDNNTNVNFMDVKED